MGQRDTKQAGESGPRARVSLNNRALPRSVRTHAGPRQMASRLLASLFPASQRRQGPPPLPALRRRRGRLTPIVRAEGDAVPERLPQFAKPLGALGREQAEGGIREGVGGAEAPQ